MKKFLLTLLALALSFLLSQGAEAATYYVDAALGKDKNKGTSSGSPWQTINKINNSKFLPGDKILFQRGQTFTGRLVVKYSGTAAKPITLADYGSGNQPVLNGANIQYAVMLNGVNFIALKNLEVVNGQGYGVVVWNSAANGLVTIDSCNIHNNANNGVTIKDRGNVTITNCQIYANGYNGVCAYSSKDNSTWNYIDCNNMKIINNNIYNNGKHGLYIDGHNAVIQHNTFSANGSVFQSHNLYLIGDNSLIESNIFKDAYMVGFRYIGSNMVFRYNFLEANRKHNICCWNDFANVMKDNKIYYNIFLVRKLTGAADLTSMAIFVGAGSYAGIFNGVAIYNNSIYAADDNAGGIWLQQCTNIQVKNNIIDIGNGCLIYREDDTVTLTSDYNIFQSPEVSPLYTGSNFVDFSGWQKSGYDRHSRFADPGFVNPAPQQDTDFLLQPASCAIDAGAGLSLKYDYRGAPVPAAPDIGALQYH